MNWLYVYREIRKKFYEEMSARDGCVSGPSYYQHQMQMDLLRIIGEVVYAGLEPKNQKYARQYEQNFAMEYKSK